MNRITRRGGQRRYGNSLRVGMTLAAAAAVALIAGGKPSEARAADGTTDVTVQVVEGDENLAWSVPTQIPMKATAGGTLIGPGADAIAIRNLSAFPIRVKQMDTTAETPFSLVDDVDKSSGNNDFMMTVNGAAAKQTVELPDDGTWAMGYAGNGEGSDKLPITISDAKIARVTANLSAAKKAATVTWTVEPTAKAVNQDPNPDPNGVAFAVYSEDDKSLDLYKRESKPEVGDTFNGKTVTELFDVDESKGASGSYSPFKRVSSSTEKIEVVDGGIKPVSTSYWFNSLSHVDTANVVKLDTSVDTDMSYMFAKSGFTSLDLSVLDTSANVDTSGMFQNCSSLTTVGDLSGWDTSAADATRYMFSGCSSLTSLDLSGWDTSNVTMMGSMFANCSNLTAVGDLSGWNVSNVTNMEKLFSGCSGLISLDLSGWDVSSVDMMGSMFANCSSLTAVGDLSGWNVPLVNSAPNMFSGCSNITSLNLSGWDLFSITDMTSMFQNCSSLTSLDLSGWTIACPDPYVYTDYMFDGCSELTTVNGLSDLDTSSISSMIKMFNECPKLTADCSNWDVTNVCSFNGFNDNAPGVIAPNWNS